MLDLFLDLLKAITWLAIAIMLLPVFIVGLWLCWTMFTILLS
ncbi:MULTISPECIES: hypothetical protein [unclassified Moraxella]|nr:MULTISPECIES: hypothetical protein [unclassified Moraxella]